MPFIEIDFDEILEAEKEEELLKSLKETEFEGKKIVKDIKKSSIQSFGAEAIIFGIEVASVVIPVLIKIARAFFGKKVTVKFQCPESKKPVKIVLSGIKDESKITKIITKAYTTTCG